MPYSKLKARVADILKAEGFIAGWKEEDAEVGKKLTIDLKFGPNRERSIAGVRRISKPGLRVYAKSTNLPHVLGGLGIAILPGSTQVERQPERFGGFADIGLAGNGGPMTPGDRLPRWQHRRMDTVMSVAAMPRTGLSADGTRTPAVVRSIGESPSNRRRSRSPGLAE
jgi:hypothetical protein